MRDGEGRPLPRDVNFMGVLHDTQSTCKGLLKLWRIQRWEILRTGVDMKLKCLGCDHVIWMKRMEFERRVRKILVGEKWIAIVHHHPEEASE